MKAYKTNQGAWQISYTEDSRQKTLYLGKKHTAVSADRVAKIATEIMDCRRRGDSISADLWRKIETLPLKIRNAIERAGLVNGQNFDMTLGELIDRVIETKKSLKPGTVKLYLRWKRLLLNWFGPSVSVRRISAYEALEFIRSLKHLSSATLSRGIRACRTIFAYAIKREVTTKNPFSDIKTMGEVNERRRFRVTKEIVQKLLSSCKDDRERLLIALARYAGLRIPSEVRELTFADLADRKIRVHSDTKTGARDVPMFAEIAEIFDRIKGRPDELIFDLEKFPHTKVRRVVVRLMKDADVERFPKPFVNMRSTLITELKNKGYSEKSLDAFFGNSFRVREQHYVQFEKEEEFRRMLEDNRKEIEYLCDNSGQIENIDSDIDVHKLIVQLKTLVERFESEKRDTQPDE